MKSSPKGFTLMELIVTVLIVGVVFAAGTPGLQRLLSNVLLNSNADRLVNALAYARGEAVARVDQVSIVTTVSGWNVFIDANENCVVDTAKTAIAPAAGPPEIVASPAVAAEEVLRVVDVTADNITITARCVRFNEQGEASTAADFSVGSTAVSGPDLAVSVALNGYARVN
jgi:type IV fimbrial biogenesis protein FimT